MKRIFTLCISVLLCGMLHAQVVINEYSCSNITTVTDAFGQREDWVELYNTSGASINISGYYLSDDKFAPMKWQVPAGAAIPANGRIMVYCSDRDVMAGGQLHPSFKLTQMKGEYFVISDPLGNIVDSVKLVPTQANHSRGRTTDGASGWGLFATPTPNAPNANARLAYATKPVFNLAPGNYNTPQNIVITSPDPNVTIHYTTDGTTPTAASPVYSAPIPVAVTTVIRAKAFSSDPQILPSFTETNTYMINENTTMNVVSVSGPYNGNLSTVGSTSSFVSAIEFFDENKQLKFELEGFMRRHGNDSWAFPQKGVRFHAKDQLGYDYAMKYKMFNSSPRDTFNVFILKAAGSDNFDGGPPPATHIRDAFCHTLSIKYGLELDQRNYEPCILLVNGQYWGVYEVRERVDEDYAEFYYGQSKKKVDILRYWGGLNIEAGSDTGWVNLYNFIMANNMAIPANYNHVTNFLNVKSFIQYFIINTWLVNTDWLNWNTMWWRGRKGQGVKWRYALWDQDNILALGQNYTGMGTVTYQNDPCQPFSLFQNNSTIKHTDMLKRLMDNPDFDQLYRNTFIEMLNGPLNCQNMIPHLDSLVNILDPEMQRHCNRWGASYTTWQNNVQNLRTEILNRCTVIAQKLDSCMDLNPQQVSFNVSPAGSGTIMLGTQTLSPYVWTKIMAADTLWNLTAVPAGPYWLFDHWEHYEAANSFAPDSFSASAGFNFHKKDSIVAFFKYYNPDSLFVTFDVAPGIGGQIKLDNSVISSYPYTVKLDRRFTYNLEAMPATYYDFINWTKTKSTSSLAPSMTSRSVSFNFTEPDTIVAWFESDSVDVTFDVTPANGGVIRIDNNVIPSYPQTMKLNRRFTYTLQAVPTTDWAFVEWTKISPLSLITPSTLKEEIKYSFQLSDSVKAHFRKLPPPPPLPPLIDSFSIPTAFTPNGDGLNDKFHIVWGPHIKAMELRIFNRWGQMVYYTNNQTDGWDGTFGGAPAEIGTYFYSLLVWYDNTHFNAARSYKGDLILIR